ncbi:MAG: alpha/beta hydrolase [Nevskiales bacterium]|nr:alpha/beta hydrolase [Nevskiales bacterium]
MRIRWIAGCAATVLAGCSGQQVLNALTPLDGYAVTTNVVYDRDRALTLDVYAPAQAKNAPVVVYFYGGRWTEGSKGEYKFVGQALASQGFVAVLPEYRHYPSVRFPAFVEDAARAVRWTHDHIADYGGAPQTLFVMGHSSGAHLAALLALDESYLKTVGGDRDWLRGMMGLAGPYDFMPITDPELRDMFGPPERFERSQPIQFVDGDHPPLLLLHGENDETVWVRNTRNLAAAVAKAGGTVETVIYPDMSHTWMVALLSSALQGRSDVLDQVADFVRRRSVVAEIPRPTVGPQPVIQSP